MRREGSALSGVGTVLLKELADNLTSTRMRLLELLIFVTGAGAAYSTVGAVKDQIGEYPFVFLLIFTTAHEPLPSFVGFLGFLIPIVAIALGFDSVNSEFNRRTMSRILAQPIYRDALLIGKFLAGLITLAVVLSALWLLVLGLGILLLGLPPNTDEVLRGFAFLIAAIACGGVWLALATLFSVIFRSAATAALAGLAVWLLFAFFWEMLVPIVTMAVAPADPYDPLSALRTIDVGMDISRISPNTLFSEATLAFLSPTTRALGAGALIAGPGLDPRRAAAARRQACDGVAATDRAAGLRHPAVRDRLHPVSAPGSPGLILSADAANHRARGIANGCEVSYPQSWLRAGAC